MINFLDGVGKIKLDKKWNINSFLGSSFRDTKGNLVSPDKINDSDLLKAIHAIERDSLKLQKDYDNLYREMTLKRNELTKLAKEMEARNAKDEAVVSLHSSDVALMRNQLSVIDSKAKLNNDKYKAIRDERKSWKEITSEVQTAAPNNGTQILLAGSPISAAKVAASNNLPSYMDFGPSEMMKSIPVIEPEAPKVPEAEVSTEETTAAAAPTAFRNPRQRTNNTTEEDKEADPLANLPEDFKLAVLRKQEEIEKAALSAQLPEKELASPKLNEDLIKQRLAVGTNALGAKMSLGHTYKNTLNSIMTKHTPHKRILKINPDTGKFWEEAYTTDKDGNWTVPVKTYQYNSVTHLGELEIDVKNKKVTTQYEEKAIDFDLAYDDSEMPVFYKQEWEKPSSEKFLIPVEITDSMLSIHGKK